MKQSRIEELKLFMIYLYLWYFLYLAIREGLRSMHLNTIKNAERRTQQSKDGSSCSQKKASVEDQDVDDVLRAIKFMKNRKRIKSDIGPDQASDDKTLIGWSS